VRRVASDECLFLRLYHISTHAHQFLLCCECITRCQVSMPEKAVKLVCEFLFGYVGQATVSSPAVFSPPSGFCHVEFQNACISV